MTFIQELQEELKQKEKILSSMYRNESFTNDEVAFFSNEIQKLRNIISYISSDVEEEN